MNFKPLIILAIIVVALLQLKTCEFGAEFQDVKPKYKKAHLTAVEAQDELEDKNFKEALKLYRAAKRELEHPEVNAASGKDDYVNYGFIMNDIGVIHLGWALYGYEMNTGKTRIRQEDINQQEIQKAIEALQTAVDFYQRWYKHHPKEYKPYARAIAESYANLGTAYKYSHDHNQQQAVNMFGKALICNPDHKNAKRGLEMLHTNPEPFIEKGKEQQKENKRVKKVLEDILQKEQ